MAAPALESRAPPVVANAEGLPPSATHFGITLAVLVGVLGVIYWLRGQDRPLEDEVLILCGAVAFPLVVLEVVFLKVHLRESTGLDYAKPFEPDVARVATKLLGLALTVGIIALAYGSFPEYRGSFYGPLWSVLQRAWLPLVVAAPIYVWLVDGRMTAPRDSYWQLGRLVLGRWSDVSGADVAHHFRSWLVKAFFVPLMVVWLHGHVRDMMTFDLGHASWSNLRAYDYIHAFVYGIDVLFCTVGYVMCLRPLDSHVRTAEPTMVGWAVALFCYEPFFSGLFEPQYVRYGNGYSFDRWLEPYPRLRWAWASVIIALVVIYTLASVVFGTRFSNLTRRGVITGGPYRFTKHPAYLSKNLSWWLVSVPFLPHGGWAEAVRHSITLGCINAMYFLRARTEERHLSRDPAYVAYALWINEHGVLAPLGRWFPALRFVRPPERGPGA